MGRKKRKTKKSATDNAPPADAFDGDDLFGSPFGASEVQEETPAPTTDAPEDGGDDVAPADAADGSEKKDKEKKKKKKKKDKTTSSSGDIGADLDAILGADDPIPVSKPAKKSDDAAKAADDTNADADTGIDTAGTGKSVKELGATLNIDPTKMMGGPPLKKKNSVPSENVLEGGEDVPQTAAAPPTTDTADVAAVDLDADTDADPATPVALDHPTKARPPRADRRPPTRRKERGVSAADEADATAAGGEDEETGGVVAAVKEVVDDVIEGATEIKELGNDLAEQAEAAVADVVEGAVEVKDMLNELGAAAEDGVTDTVEGAVEVKDMLNELGAAAEDGVTDTVEGAVEVKDMLNELGAATEDGVTDTVEGAVEVKDMLNELSAAAEDGVTDTVEGVNEGVNEMAEAASAAVGGGDDTSSTKDKKKKKKKKKDKGSASDDVAAAPATVGSGAVGTGYVATPAEIAGWASSLTSYFTLKGVPLTGAAVGGGGGKGVGDTPSSVDAGSGGAADVTPAAETGAQTEPAQQPAQEGVNDTPSDKLTPVAAVAVRAEVQNLKGSATPEVVSLDEQPAADDVSTETGAAASVGDGSEGVNNTPFDKPTPDTAVAILAEVQNLKGSATPEVASLDEQPAADDVSTGESRDSQAVEGSNPFDNGVVAAAAVGGGAAAAAAVAVGASSASEAPKASEPKPPTIIEMISRGLLTRQSGGGGVAVEDAPITAHTPVEASTVELSELSDDPHELRTLVLALKREVANITRENVSLTRIAQAEREQREALEEEGKETTANLLNTSLSTSLDRERIKGDLEYANERIDTLTAEGQTLRSEKADMLGEIRKLEVELDSAKSRITELESVVAAHRAAEEKALKEKEDAASAAASDEKGLFTDADGTNSNKNGRSKKREESIFSDDEDEPLFPTKRRSKRYKKINEAPFTTSSKKSRGSLFDDPVLGDGTLSGRRRGQPTLMADIGFSTEEWLKTVKKPSSSVYSKR